MRTITYFVLGCALVVVGVARGEETRQGGYRLLTPAMVFRGVMTQDPEITDLIAPKLRGRFAPLLNDAKAKLFDETIRQVEDKKLRLGKHELNVQLDKSSDGQSSIIRMIMPFPVYNSNQLQYDWGLVDEFICPIGVVLDPGSSDLFKEFSPEKLKSNSCQLVDLGGVDARTNDVMFGVEK